MVSKMDLDLLVKETIQNVLIVSGDNAMSYIIETEIKSLVDIARRTGYLEGKEAMLDNMSKSLGNRGN